MSEVAVEAPPQGASTATLPPAEQAFLDSLPDGDEPTNTPAEAPAAAEAAPPEEGTTEVKGDPLDLPDSFTSQDVRGMLEGITDPAARSAAEAAVKNFQADYTRSKQALSEQAQQFEGLDDLEKARAAVEFYDGIQNDPEFAQEVHGWLGDVFERMGLPAGEAATAATEVMTTPSEAAQAPPSFEDDPDAALKSELESLKGEFSSWKEQDAQRQAQQREDELAAELLRQEMALRSAHPKLDEKDLDEIYDVAMSRGGNLMEAHQALVARDQRTIERYMNEKQSAPPPEPTPASSVSPPDIPRLEDGTPDMEAIHKIAVQRLKNAQAGQE